MILTQSAAEILDRLGQPVTFAYESDPVRDPVTGAITEPGEAVGITGSGYPDRFTSMQVDGDSVRRTDIRLTAGGLSEQPQVGWTCTTGGVTYKVLDVQTVTKSGADVIYICQLRL
jgi:hypothetical protein